MTTIAADACPHCGGPPGAGRVTIQTWEYQDTTLLTNKDRYLVRTVEVPAVCGGCVSHLDGRRLAADLVCLAPLVALFLALVFSGSKLMLFALLAYLIYLARHLDYNWADRLLYGSDLEHRLAAFVPPGDVLGTTFPVSWWHVAVRVGGIPAGLVALVSLGGVLMPFLGGRPSDGEVAASAKPAQVWAKDRAEHEREVLELDQLAVAGSQGKVSFYTQMMGGKPVQVLRAWADPARVPAGTSVGTMTGRQLAMAFLGERRDSMLVIEGAGETVALYRFQVERIYKSLKR